MLTSDLVPTGGAAKSTTSIVNYCSTGAALGGLSGSGENKVSLSGALTAATLKSMLSVSGSAGVMPVCVLKTVDATARTVRLKITIDGNVVFDATTGSISTANTGLVAASANSGGSPIAGTVIHWKTSCLIEIASSLTETDKLSLVYNYNLES